MPDLALLILGAVLGGLVNGLSGFGFAIMALGVWPHINLRHTAPFVLGGLLGVPIGVALLGVVSVPLFKGFVAVVNQARARW